MVYYFAYGSNMDESQMKGRCPNARFANIGVLNAYRLAFNRYSFKRKCGVADAVPAPDACVWGVVYFLIYEDYERLKEKEGVKKGYYEPREVVVQRPTAAGNEDQTVTAFFVPDAEKRRYGRKDLSPSAAYMELIINGACRHCRHGLPKDYIDKVLAPIKTCD